MVYCSVFLFISILTYLFDVKGRKENKSFWYGILTTLLIIIAGFRFRLGGDTITYTESFYHIIPELSEIKVEEIFSYEYEPFFTLLNSAVKTAGYKFFIVQLIHATFVNFLFLFYFWKHSKYPFLCSLFYYVWSYFLLNFEEMRASMGIGICLYANDLVLGKKYLKGLFLYLLAGLFHYTCIALIITPFMTFMRFNKIGWLFITLTFVGGIFILSKIEDAFLMIDLGDRISGRAIRYLNNEEYLVVHNIKYYIVGIGAFLFYSYFSVRLSQYGDEYESLKKLEPLLIMGLLFMILKSNLGIITRFVRFYEPYFILFFSDLFIIIVQKQTSVSRVLSVLKAGLVFIPFFYNITSFYFYRKTDDIELSKHYNYERYYPYSSILEKSLDDRRERMYLAIGYDKFNPREY